MSVESLLEVRDLAVEYRGDDTVFSAVRELSLSVLAGEIVALVGESGSGKSTTVQALVGLLPSTAHITHGEIRVGSRDVVGLSERAMRRALGSTIGYVPQDPTVSLDPVKTIGAQVAEVFHIHERLPRHLAKARAIALLEKVGIDSPVERYGQYPHELSGGMRQRVLIAIALAVSPRLIVADEPTSGLDVTVQRRILDELERLARADGIGVLLVTHDLGVVHERADRVFVLEHGRVVESGAVSDVFASPVHAYSRALLSAVPSGRPARAVARDRIAVPTSAQPPLLVADSITKRFMMRGRGAQRTHVVAVDDVSFSVAPGATLGVVGESGSGKSTLARIVTGLETPTTGEVRFDGVSGAGLGARERRERRRHIQYVYQNPYASLDPRLTIRRIIDEPLRAFQVGDPGSCRDEVRRLLDVVALPRTFETRTPGELSGGQRQRVAIARALALRPRLVVLDEPVSALDVSVQAQILDLLISLQDEFGLTYVFISHDLAVIRQISDETIVLRTGELVEGGRTAEIFAHPREPYTVSLLDAIPRPRASDTAYPGVAPTPLKGRP